MRAYDHLDSLIVKAIHAGSSSLSEIMRGNVGNECQRIADATWRESFRVLDARLQALRKSGQITFDRPFGWMTQK